MSPAILATSAVVGGGGSDRLRTRLALTPRFFVRVFMRSSMKDACIGDAPPSIQNTNGNSAACEMRARQSTAAAGK
jgi:hypothetical protein